MAAFRLDPALPPEHRKTYSIIRPRKTHSRAGTCEQAECGALAHGWVSVIDERTELGRNQARYIRQDSGRTFTETRDDAGLTRFAFPAGQRCFSSTEDAYGQPIQGHTLQLEKPPLFIVGDGDHRGNPRGTAPQRHQRAEDWVDDFATHQQSLADKIKEG